MKAAPKPTTYAVQKPAPTPKPEVAEVAKVTCLSESLTPPLLGFAEPTKLLTLTDQHRCYSRLRSPRRRRTLPPRCAMTHA